MPLPLKVRPVDKSRLSDRLAVNDEFLRYLESQLSSKKNARTLMTTAQQPSCLCLHYEAEQRVNNIPFLLLRCLRIIILTYHSCRIMPKGKKFFTAALAAVKVKKAAQKAATKKELEKKSSSSGSEYSSGSSEYSSSEYSSGDEDSEGGSSYTSGSDEEEEISKPPLRKKEEPVPNKPSTETAAYDDDSSDSSFSNGCGVYRRREDLTPDSSLASSSSNDDESSYESESDYSSSKQSQGQEASSGEESDSDYSSANGKPQSSKNYLNEKDTIDANKSKASGSENADEPKKRSFFTKRPSFSREGQNEAVPSKARRPSSDSRGSQESTGEASRSSKASKSSKGSKVSESSSKKKKLSFGALSKMKKTKETSSPNKGSADAFDEDEDLSREEDSSSSEDSFPSRSSKGSSKISERSKASTKYADEDSHASSKYSRKSKTSDASRTSKASKSSKSSESKNTQNGANNPSLFDEDQLSMMRRGAGRGKGAQAGDGRGKPPLGRAKLGRQANMEQEGKDEESEDTFGSLLQKARNMREMKTTGEASNSNAGPDGMQKYKDNAELSHSFKTQSLRNANANLKTSFSEENQNVSSASDAQGTSSSRFAAMMKDLKSSSEKTKPDTTPSSTSSDGDDEGDDVHVFHAPKIVSDDDVPVEQGENIGSKSGSESEDRKSRFRTRSESIKKLLQSKSNNEESSSSTGSEEGSDVEVDDEESDEENTGEQLQAGSGSFHGDSSEEYSSEDEDEAEYYEEDQVMTILTPITEADNETIASTIKPKPTDDDSDEKFNSIISPKASVDLGEQKSYDKEESHHSSEDASDCTSNTSQSDNASNNNNQKREISQSNGHHAPVIIDGQDKKYQQNGILNQMSATNIRMPDVARLSMSEAIARVKANDPNFTAINLDESDLNDFNATRLFFSLNGNEHITHISLAHNSLGDGSAASLAHLLRDNEHIIYLCLRGNQIRDKGAMAMSDAMEENRTLVFLDLHDNYINPALLESVERGAYLQSTQNSQSSNIDGAGAEDSSYNTSRSAQSSFDSCAPEKPEKNFLIEQNLLKIDEGVCPTAAKDQGKMFDAAISSATNSDERSVDEDALLLALSLSLYNLDAEWALNSARGKTLGDRKRIAPWKTAELNCKERESVTESMDSDTSGLVDSEGREEEKAKSNSRLWMRAFKKIDPRWQIRKCFNDISLFGGVLNDINQLSSAEGSSIFTVWRPTSAAAISKMMRGEGVGKGLEIKGKSAKEGDLSGFIPFLQIHEEEHKKGIRSIGKGDRTKIFFNTESWRDEVGEFLGTVAKEMTLSFTKSKFAMARLKYGCDPDAALHEEHYEWKAMGAVLNDPYVTKIDDYAPQVFGIEVSCRVLWKGLVERKDISRFPGSKFYTGRESQPAFQDMNFSALRLKDIDGPLPVLYQCADEDPFDARMLVMAYEEEGKVTPVVSDFDCFLIGTSKFHYSDPMPPEQIDLLDWCVSQIEWILESHTEPESWTTRWLEVLKFAATNDFYPSMPKFGFGDPTSHSMIEASATRLAKSSGAVRHGAECFNYFFPQELDEHFLVVYPGNQIWKYVNAKELQNILHEKIREGYTFPLNPKWLLCDPGWISLFKELLQSDEPSVRHSIDQWFPESGLRERILDISNRFPNGFESKDDAVSQCGCIAQHEYERYLVLQRAKQKMKSFVYWKDLLRDVREYATSDANANCVGALQSLDFLGDKRQELAKVESSNLEGKVLEEIQKQSFFV